MDIEDVLRFNFMVQLLSTLVITTVSNKVTWCAMVVGYFICLSVKIHGRFTLFKMIFIPAFNLVSTQLKNVCELL